MIPWLCFGIPSSALYFHCEMLFLLLAICIVTTKGLKELHPPHLLPPAMPTGVPHFPPFGGPLEVQSTTPTVPPVFQQDNNTELHSQVGTTAVLHCHTEHVGENTVSWVRRRDYHLLTVGVVVYSSDQRFSVRYVKHEKDWQLHIRYVQKRDEGIYECQIATHPPISLLSNLHVVEATSEILGGPEKYMTAGSSLRLVCVLRKHTQPPSYVFWYHGDRMINYDNKVKVETGGEVSVLFLGEVGPHSSGNYSCVPSNTQSSHIHVHVLRGGETPAAIHSGASKLSSSFSWVFQNAQKLLSLLQLELLYITNAVRNFGPDVNNVNLAEYAYIFVKSIEDLNKSFEFMETKILSKILAANLIKSTISGSIAYLMTVAVVSALLTYIYSATCASKNRNLSKISYRTNFSSFDIKWTKKINVSSDEIYHEKQDATKADDITKSYLEEELQHHVDVMQTCHKKSISTSAPVCATVVAVNKFKQEHFSVLVIKLWSKLRKCIQKRGAKCFSQIFKKKFQQKYKNNVS